MLLFIAALSFACSASPTFAPAATGVASGDHFGTFSMSPVYRHPMTTAQKRADADADGNPDIFEIDNDDDGLTDRDELLALGTDHNNPDSDDDTLPDGYEVSHGLNPVLADADADADDDGLTNAEEFAAGTLPNRPTAIITDGWNLLGTSWTAAQGLGYAQQAAPAVLLSVSRHADGEDVAVAPGEPLVPTVGYWAFAVGDALVDFPGTPADDHTVTLSVGWNLIAPLSDGPIPAEITGPVWAWQGARFVMATEMRALWAYWVYSAEEAIIQVP